MSIREYSMTRDSTRQLSPSFRVREFACKGSDVVLIDDELVVLLQCIREHFGKPVHITSGYLASRARRHRAVPEGCKASRPQDRLGAYRYSGGQEPVDHVKE